MSQDSRPSTYEHIAQVRGLLLGVVSELLRRSQRHDRSKLTAPERSVFDTYTPLLAKATYGSPEYKSYLEGMGEALQHHYIVNDHHPEHFEGGIADMDLVQLTEMLCDWIAASRRHVDGDVHRSIDQNAERFGYGEEIRRLLHNTVDQIIVNEAAF